MQERQVFRLITSQLSGRYVMSSLEVDPDPLYHRSVTEWSRPSDHVVVRAAGTAPCEGCRGREAQIEVQRFDRLPLPSQSADRIFVIGVGALLRTDARSLLSECFRVIRAGGDLLVATIVDDARAPLATELDAVLLPFLRRVAPASIPLSGRLATMQLVVNAALDAGWDAESERSWISRDRFVDLAALSRFVRPFLDAHYVPQLQSRSALSEAEVGRALETVLADPRASLSALQTVLTFRRAGPLPAATVGQPGFGALRRGSVLRRGLPGGRPARARHVTWILERLAISSAPRTWEHMRELEVRRITHVLDLRQEPHYVPSLPWPSSLSVISYPMADDLTPFSPRFLRTVLGIVHSTLRVPEHRIVIACDGGEHRSPLITYLYLRSIGVPARTALALIRGRRPIVDFPVVYLRSAEDALRQFNATSAGS